MSQVFSPNLFLFQSYVSEVLKEGRKHIKIGVFENLEPETLLSNDKNQFIDVYHPYFLLAMGHSRTRQLACINYEKLLRQNLVEKDHLPPAMISSILGACSTLAGSGTGSSSLGSTNLSASSQSHSVFIGNLVKAVLIGSFQPTHQLVVGLNYLLEGTRKKYSTFYISMMEQLYSSFLIKFRQPPILRFVTLYISNLLDEVEIHANDPEYHFATRRIDPVTLKPQIPIFDENSGFGKFGRCFICSRQANHYVKQDFTPVCSVACRDKTRQLSQQCRSQQFFDFLSWLLDSQPPGDEIIYSFLSRQLSFLMRKSQAPKQKYILSFLRVSIHHLNQHNLSPYILPTLLTIFTEFRTKLANPYQQSIKNMLWVHLMEILTLIEDWGLGREAIQHIKFIGGLIRDENIFMWLFLDFDSKFFQISVLSRTLNIVSQFARRFDEGKQALESMLKMLMKKLVEGSCTSSQINSFNPQQFLKKRQLKKVITFFNRKPLSGIKYLKRLFQDVIIKNIGNQQSNQIISRQSLSQNYSQISEPSFNPSLQSVEQQTGEIKDTQQTQEIDQKKKTKRIINNKKNLPKITDKLQKMEISETGQMQTQEEQQRKRKFPTWVQSEEQKERQRRDNIKQIQERVIQDQIENAQLQNQQEQDLDRDLTLQQDCGEEKQSEEESEPVSRVSGIDSQLDTEEIVRAKIAEIFEQSQSAKTGSKSSKLSPKEIAAFMLLNLQGSRGSNQNRIIGSAGLNRIKVGEYFGLDDEEARKVCFEFIGLLGVQNLQIDDALRVVLNLFVLPKQTQQVERIIGSLSSRLVGRYGLSTQTAVFQYIYVLMMVQTSNQNPNVQERERLTLENHLSMCRYVEGGVDKQRAIRDFNRLLEVPLNVKMNYSEQSIFVHKYYRGQPVEGLFVGLEPEGARGLERNISLHIWEYLLIGLTSGEGSRGLGEAMVLYGRFGLAEEQGAFFQALRKAGQREEGVGERMLRLATEYGNWLHGSVWDYVIAVVYGFDNEHEFNSVLLDRLFTHSSALTPPRLLDLLTALLRFSSSQFKRESHYDRELFVLRHINSLLQYNLSRFGSIADLLWPPLSGFFRDICLHPRKEVAVAAVDAYKQLVLKLFRAGRNNQGRPEHHAAALQTYLHIFERSGTDQRDLMLNILANLVTADLRAGWEDVYALLNTADCPDKRLVLKIVNRLLSEVGFPRLTALPRLHSVCIKELRTCPDPEIVEQLTTRVWEISEYIDSPDIWLETMRSTKDIYKMSLNADLLALFVRIANRCLVRKSEGVSGEVQRQIYGEVVELMVFLLEPHPGSESKRIQVLSTALECLQQLDLTFMGEFLGGSYGFLSIFQMFLGSPLKIPFALFLRGYLPLLVSPLLTPNHASALQQLSLWVVHQYYDSLPLDLVNLKEADGDFEKNLQQVVREIEEGRRQEDGRNDLIEFHLSHREFYQKSVLHLIFLDITEQLLGELERNPQPPILTRLRPKLTEAVLDSYQCAHKVNRLILLRNFLWNNGFLPYASQLKGLPGLHKQQHRTLRFLLTRLNFSISYPYFLNLLQSYLQQLPLAHRLKNLVEKEIRVYESKSKEKEGKKQKEKELKKEKEKIKEGKRREEARLQTYLGDVELWLGEASRSLVIGLREVRWQLEKEDSFFKQKEKQYPELAQLCLRLLEQPVSQALVGEVTDLLGVLYQQLM